MGKGSPVQGSLSLSKKARPSSTKGIALRSARCVYETEIGLAGGVAGVHDDGQMGLFVDDGHCREIEGVAGVLLEGTDAALAQNDLLVAAGHDILGTHDPLPVSYTHLDVYKRQVL